MYWMLIHRLYSLLENLTPALQGITTLLALSLSLQKVISSFRQTSCFIMVGNMLRMCVCVCVCARTCARVHMLMCVQTCPTLRDPMDCNSPGSSVHGIFQARILG